jgi:hypothetical protein
MNRDTVHDAPVWFVRLNVRQEIIIHRTFEVSHGGQRQLPGVGCDDWIGSSSRREIQDDENAE